MSRGRRAKGAASWKAPSALHAAGTHDNVGSARTARVNASCVARAISPSVDDSDAKLALTTAPVFGFVLTSAAARYRFVTGPSSRFAVAAIAAALTLGDGSFSAQRTIVAVGDRANSCVTLVGKSLGQCACIERESARANAETQSAAFVRTFEAPNRSPNRSPFDPLAPSASLASESEDPYPRSAAEPPPPPPPDLRCGGTYPPRPGLDGTSSDWSPPDRWPAPDVPYAKNLRRCVTSAPTVSSGHVRRRSPPPAPAHACAHLVAAANSLADPASSGGRSLPSVAGAPAGEAATPRVSASNAAATASPTAAWARGETEPGDARPTKAPRALNACLAVSLAPFRALLDSASPPPANERVFL
mmetsp:Transcript_10295/g.42593  ORF Transcript_10295/g.42593 Transcript_10295/m.42593 type:complete len:360 (-) Transcript_10295:194-1273(-)